MNGRDGGPAFPGMLPLPNAGAEQARNFAFFSGLTLRDYFAAKFAAAELMTCGVPGEACDALVEAIEQTGESPEDHMARCAYELADAMLRAREVQP